MAKRIEFVSTADWRGGLNLRADEFLLDENESPDLLNVDVDPRGGFRQRKGVTTYGAMLPAEVQSLHQYSTTGGALQIIASTAAATYYSTGGDWALAWGMDGPIRSATFKDRFYAQNGVAPPYRWQGDPSDSGALGQNWNEDLTAPTAPGVIGNMPIATHVAAHLSTMFLGHTVEGGVQHPNRIRFSHPNFPEDWRSFDWIDVDTGLDGDVITALVPFQDILLIFKRRSVYALYGDGPETFRVEAITREVGAISKDAVVATDEGVFFFAWPEGVFLLDKGGPRWQFEKLQRAVLDGRIPHSSASKIKLGWGNRRLWVSVPWEGSTSNERVFVLDPSLTKDGSWVAYDLKVGPFLEWAPPGGEALFLAHAIGRDKIIRLDQETEADFYTETPTPIRGRYRTRWYDVGGQILKKQWKRPELVMAGGSTSEVYVKVYHDWDATEVKRDFRVSTLADDASLGGVWDDPDTNWDEAEWVRGEASGGPNVMERGSPLGTSRSVSLEFVGPDTPTTWGVGSLSLKYIVKRPRS